MSTPSSHSQSDLPEPADLLGAVCAQREAEAAAARETLRLIVAWAASHRVPGLADLEDGQIYADREVELAGPGAPGVSEFAIVELAAAVGMTPRSAKAYVGDAMELAHRLPVLYDRVLAGQVATWRARTVAQRTKQLSALAAAWVDVRVGPAAPTLGPARIQRLVEQAITLFDLDAQTDTATDVTLDPRDQAYVTITPLGVGGPGACAGLGEMARIEALLPLPDALALDAAIAARAHDLLTDPDHASLGLDGRRALALGSLADSALAAGGRHLALTVHLGEPDLVPHATHPGLQAGRDTGHELATVHTGTGEQHIVTTRAVESWCRSPLAAVRVRRVFDPGVLISDALAQLAPPSSADRAGSRAGAAGRALLAEIETWTAPLPSPPAAGASAHRPRVTERQPIDLTRSITCVGYAPSRRLREQVLLLSPTCAFPHCAIPATRCDLDHIRAWLAGGATTTLNLAPLCRLHHRAKTHDR